MNGINDLGGMQDMGAVPYEKNAPYFHAHWEERIFALLIASTTVIRLPVWYAMERIPPIEYLRQSYYERWLTALSNELLRNGIATAVELRTGVPISSKVTGIKPMSVAEVEALIKPGQGFSAPGESDQLPSPSKPVALLPPRFRVGQAVRVHNMSPLGYVRCPRYVRGQVGTVYKVCAPGPCQDSDAEGRVLDADTIRQIYLVQFPGENLWGKDADPRSAVYVSLRESYLDAA